MTEVKWNLKNVKSNEVVHITKPIFKVGRHVEADLKTELKEVSRNHATLSILIGGHLYVHDNKSCNGTFVNKRKIEPLNNVPLEPGDILAFGMPTQMIEETSNISLIFEVSREEMIPVMNGQVEDPMNNPEVIHIVDGLDELHLPLEVNEVVGVEANVNRSGEVNLNMPVDRNQDRPVGANEGIPVDANGDIPVEVNEDKPVDVNEDRPVDANEDVPIDVNDDRPADADDNRAIDANVVRPVEKHEDCKKVIPSTGEEVEDKLQYSINDDDCIIDECIVISDEEDDEPFAQSQIFDMSARIKREQTSYHESIDPYFEIKQELTDLQCDAENQIPVDLTDDIDHFESTTDLLNILETSESLEAKKCENIGTSSVDELKDLLEIDLTQERKEQREEKKYTENHIATIRSSPKRGTSDTVTTRSKNTAESIMKNPTISPVNPMLVIPLSRESTSRRSNQNSKPRASPRTIKVIPPMTAKPCTDKEKKESSSKRKSTKTEFESNKKPRTGNSDKAASRISGHMPSNEKKEIALERKKKLREIAEKRSHNSEGMEKGLKASISTSYAMPSTSTGITRDPRQCRKNGNSLDRSARKNERSVLQNNRIILNDIQDMTISSNYSPKSDSDQNFNKRPAMTANNKPAILPRTDSTVPEDRSGIIWNLGPKNHTVPTVSRYAEDLTDEIHRILRWSVKWLMEQNNLDISPPVYGERELVHVPRYFETFPQYEAVMSPLIMLELWQLIHQTAYSKEDERPPITAVITHDRKVDPVHCFDCEVPMLSDSEMFRPEDFCLIELKVTDSLNNNNGYQYTGYGYIKHVNKTFQGPRPCVRFTLLTKNFNMQIRGNKILVKVIGNVSSSFRLFKTMKYLTLSPLCKYVFKPNTIEQLPRFSTTNLMHIADKLNNQQREIVAEASEVCMRNSPGFYLIKGPPGTGKSTVITSIISNVLFKSIASNKPAVILLTAPSNAAVDGLLSKLMDVRELLSEAQKKNLKLVRIGPDSSINQNVNKFKLSTMSRKHIMYNRALVPVEAYNYCLEHSLNKDQFLKKHLGQRFMYEVNTAEDVLVCNANVICTTLNSCVGYRISQAVRKGRLKFTCCIIDEATQCNEVESLIPIQLGIDKFVLVGDPQQLPAVVCNKEAQKLGYGNSLFSRIDDNLKNNRKSPIRMLTTQYRMKSEICEYPNKRYYEGKLKSMPMISNPITPAIKPYLVFNLTRNESRDPSDYVNSDEAHLIRILLETLNGCVNPICKYTVGIITPYKAQKELVSREISNIRMSTKVSVTVNTVDSFQGLENDVIIISCVRYTVNYFLQNERRLNVALTRAKQALYIIGNRALFKHCKPLYDLREDAKRRKCLLDIRDDPRNISSLQKYVAE